MSGKIIPKELRDNSLTTDVSSVIPVELVNKIIEKMDNTGMILPEITKTSYAAGITVPTSTTKPVATWVNEGASSDKQKKTTTSITFTYHKIRCLRQEEGSLRKQIIYILYEYGADVQRRFFPLLYLYERPGLWDGEKAPARNTPAPDRGSGAGVCHYVNPIR